MKNYLAKYTIYLADSEKDAESMRPIFELDPENFEANEKWELKKDYYHPVKAQADEGALEMAENYRQEFSKPDMFFPRIGATLDGLFEIRKVQSNREKFAEKESNLDKILYLFSFFS